MKLVFAVLYAGIAVYLGYQWWLHTGTADGWLWLSAEFVFGDRAVTQFSEWADATDTESL